MSFMLKRSEVSKTSSSEVLRGTALLADYTFDRNYILRHTLIIRPARNLDIPHFTLVQEVALKLKAET
jgi:hypothetical protein